MAYEWCQRLGDMRLLTWDAIDFEARTVYIEQSKRKAEVHLPIEDDLFDMLIQQEEDFGFQKYVAPRPKPREGVYIPYSMTKLPLHGRKLMDQAGLPRELRLSDLRRTGTTEMVEAGVGMAQIMSVTGHANPSSVKPYLKNTLSSANNALTARKSHGISIASAAKESDIT
jgi:integrase